MKYLFGIIGAILLYLIVRPLATIGYIILYRKSPNFKAYFLYAEKSALRNIHKYLVYKNVMDYVMAEEPAQIVYAQESIPFRYFPEMVIEFS